jgi:hypothetical protein
MARWKRVSKRKGLWSCVGENRDEQLMRAGCIPSGGEVPTVGGEGRGVV